MKSINRLVVGVLIIWTLPFMLLIRHVLDLGNQYSAFSYIQTSFKNSLFHTLFNDPPALAVEADDKVVVMAKLESEDTNWVAKELPSSVATSPLSF